MGFSSPGIWGFNLQYSNQEADYAHRIAACPPGFENLTASLLSTKYVKGQPKNYSSKLLKLSMAVKVNSVQKACTKLMVSVQLANYMKKMEQRTSVFSFSSINKSIILFFMWFARFQILIYVNRKAFGATSSTELTLLGINNFGVYQPVM